MYAVINIHINIYNFSCCYKYINCNFVLLFCKTFKLFSTGAPTNEVQQCAKANECQKILVVTLKTPIVEIFFESQLNDDMVSYETITVNDTMLHVLPDFVPANSPKNPTGFIQIHIPMVVDDIIKLGNNLIGQMQNGEAMAEFEEELLISSMNKVKSSVNDIISGYTHENIKRSIELEASRKRRDVVASEPKEFLQILDDFMIKPYTFLFDQFDQHYPTDAVNRMAYEHQFVNLDPIYNLEFDELHKVLNIPQEEITQINLFIEKLAEDLPQLFTMVGSSASKFQHDLTNYVAYNYPALEFIRNFS